MRSLSSACILTERVDDRYRNPLRGWLCIDARSCPAWNAWALLQRGHGVVWRGWRRQTNMPQKHVGSGLAHGRNDGRVMPVSKVLALLPSLDKLRDLAQDGGAFRSTATTNGFENSQKLGVDEAGKSAMMGARYTESRFGGLSAAAATSSSRGVDEDEKPANMAGSLRRKPSGRNEAASTTSETRC